MTTYTMSQLFIFGSCTVLSVCFYFNISHTSHSKPEDFEKSLTFDNSSDDLAVDAKSLDLKLQQEEHKILPEHLDEKGNVLFSMQLKALFADRAFFYMFLSTGLMTGVLGGIGNTINEVVSIFGFP